MDNKNRWSVLKDAGPYLGLAAFAAATVIAFYSLFGWTFVWFAGGLAAIAIITSLIVGLVGRALISSDADDIRHHPEAKKALSESRNDCDWPEPGIRIEPWHVFDVTGRGRDLE